MNSSDFFNYSTAMLFGVLVVFVSWASYRLIKTLEKIDLLLLEIKGVTDEIDLFKSGIRMGLVTLITALVARLRLPPKGGE